MTRATQEPNADARPDPETLRKRLAAGYDTAEGSRIIAARIAANTQPQLEV